MGNYVEGEKEKDERNSEIKHRTKFNNMKERICKIYTEGEKQKDRSKRKTSKLDDTEGEK